MEPILREIALNTRPSNEWAFTLTSPPGGNADSFEVFFSQPIVPERGEKLELALLSLRTSYSWPNIRAGVNNEFRYSHDDGATWTTIARGGIRNRGHQRRHSSGHARERALG